MRSHTSRLPLVCSQTKRRTTRTARTPGLVISALFTFNLGVLFATFAPSAQADETDALRHFEVSIRPLLVARCLGCHGPTKSEGGLRLDSAAAIAAGGDGGAVIEPGKAQVSRLIEAVEHRGDFEMPPERPLDPAEITALRQWIDSGAPWPEPTDPNAASLAGSHWAFRPVEAVAVPDSAFNDQTRRPLDRFLAAPWSEVGLTPTSDASREVWLRRLSYDLTGLPPAFDEVAAFSADSRPDADQRQIDRLLASAAFGEHWARRWLDVARYADTKGYVFFEQKEYPWAWAYRDWVVEAFDQDLPYDQFLIDQLAADRVATADDSARLAALGFLTVGGHFINNTHDIIDDRIDVVTRGLTGLTVACARCHDHKYDPVSQADYYALYGIFASSYEPMVPPALTPSDPNAAPTEYEIELQKRQGELESFIETKVAGLAVSGRQRVDEYLLAVHERRKHPTAEDFMLIADPEDINPAMITRYEAYLRDRTDLSHPVWGPWNWMAQRDDAVAEGEPLDPQRAAEMGWNPAVVQALCNPAPSSLTQLAKAYGELFREVDQRRNSEALAAEPVAAPRLAALSPADLQALEHELFATGVPAVLPAQLDWGFLSLFPDRATQGEYNKRIQNLEAWLKDAAAPTRAMAILDRPEPSDSPIFHRGNPNRPGELVARSVPVPGRSERLPVNSGSGRLELAKSLVDPEHPLTDRVWVNRVWMHLFAWPLAESPGDFGLRSDPPLHRSLLDHLVGQLRSRDRSLKALVRELVSSSAYRRSSDPLPAALAVDPENRYWWRHPQKRLSFESMRDSLLAISGRLSFKRGGPSEPALDAFGRRRTLYAFIDRLDVAPLLTRFDVPDPAATAVQRNSTTVPPQALFWLNHPELESLARETEQLVRTESLAAFASAASVGSASDASSDPIASDTDRIHRLIGRIWQRPATELETEACLEFLAAERIAAEQAAAETTAAAAADDSEAWVRLTHALLMANETIFID